MESKDDVTPELVFEGYEPDLKIQRVETAEFPEGRELVIHPFKRFVNSLRGHKGHRLPLPEKYVEGWPAEDDSHLSPYHGVEEEEWKRSSGYSSQLGMVKTATMSTGTPISRSRGTTQSTHTHVDNEDTRMSMDSLRPTFSSGLDEAAYQRSIKRRRVLQELIDTESHYVSGLKSLSNVLILFSIRSEICDNIETIRELHDRFLTQLQSVSPKSNLPAEEIAGLASRGLQTRLSAMDLPGLKVMHNKSLRTRTMKARMDVLMRSAGADPREAWEVTREIDGLLASFTAYEEFCNNYELLNQDVALLRRSVQNWSVLDQGIEALSKSVASMDNRKFEENKSLTLNDLLIKPIQRLCKYPLLIQDLLKNTPSIDCPTSHDAIRQILENISSMVTRINSATGNPVNRDRIQKTVLLQGKLGFSELGLLQNIYKQLGPMILCGVLHVTYQSTEYVNGQYMVCALFNNYLLLCRANDNHRRLNAVACLYVGDVKFDTLHNGRGLCCSGCSFSWKLVFQNQDNSYELVMSASSATEEKTWKTEILKTTVTVVDTRPRPEPRRFSFCSLVLAPLSDAKSGASLARRSSFRSLGAQVKFDQEQVNVIIKKTHCPNRPGEAQSIVEIDKPKISQSAMVLTTMRHDRVRLERFIADVYTRDMLPFPGMTLGKGDILRPGAIIRRFSSRSGLAKRSTSLNAPRRKIADEIVSRSNGMASDAMRQGYRQIHGRPSIESERTGSEDSSPGGIARVKTARMRGVTKQLSRPDLWIFGDKKMQSPELTWNLPGVQTVLSAIRVKKAKSRGASSEG